MQHKLQKRLRKNDFHYKKALGTSKREFLWDPFRTLSVPFWTLLGPIFDNVDPFVTAFTKGVTLTIKRPVSYTHLTLPTNREV